MSYYVCPSLTRFDADGEPYVCDMLITFDVVSFQFGMKRSHDDGGSDDEYEFAIAGIEFDPPLDEWALTEAEIAVLTAWFKTAEGYEHACRAASNYAEDQAMTRGCDAYHRSRDEVEPF
jgi:hypothetical protein